MPPTRSKPFLKWVGGKTQILDDVLARVPATMRNYYEPFLGGGSVLIAVLQARAAGRITINGTVYASDLNANLINLYKQIQANPAEVHAQLEGLLEVFNAITGTEVNRAPTTPAEAISSKESYYYWLRGRWNRLGGEHRATPAAAAMMLFLNKTCFRGVYREGPNGFNVPYGHYATCAFPTLLELNTLSSLFQSVTFTVTDFATPLAAAAAGDFVYLDPPYVPLESTSFVGYTADGFPLAQHKALFDAARAAAGRGASFLLSNADVPLVKGAFPAPAFETTVLPVRRAIHSKDPSSTAKEVLVRPAAALAP